MKTRKEIIVESIGALRACYNYYSDEPITDELLNAVHEQMNYRVPLEIETKEWNALAVERMLDGDDWFRAFKYASGFNTIPASPHSDISLKGFTIKDVVLIRHIQDGEPEGEPWRCIGQLKDDRWFYLKVGCDWSGWANGRVVVAHNYDTLMQLGCGPENTEDVWRLESVYTPGDRPLPRMASPWPIVGHLS